MKSRRNRNEDSRLENLWRVTTDALIRRRKSAIYIGRFAPSPTGRLHFGSLICALASFLDARAHEGKWLVRMEDIDPPREEPGAASAILSALEQHGLLWDDEVLWQHQRLDAYADTTDQLLNAGLAYRCNCRRKDLAALGSKYPGICRDRDLAAHQPHAVRLRVDVEREQPFEDELQGVFDEGIAATSGDFIIRRRDGLPAYQLAVAVDDAYQGITTVMRGADLLSSTPRQLYLLQTLDLVTPRYAHHPVLTNEEGQKLSKQTHATPLDERAIAGNLNFALRFLGQKEYTDGADDIELLLKTAAQHWQREQIPHTTSLYLPCP